MNFIRSLIAMMIVGFSFGLLNVFQILSVPIKWFSDRCFRRVLFWYAEKCSDHCVWWLNHFSKIRPTVIADHLPPGENAILISNHQAFADVVIIMYLASLYRRVGHLKFFVKNLIKYIPGPGWGLFFTGSIFLKRNWEGDSKNIDKGFAHIRNKKLPFWLVSFTEGTRATPAKIEASVRYMKSLGQEPFHHVLCPRSKGFWSTTQQLGPLIDAVYDLTIDYKAPKPPSFWTFISGRYPNFSIKLKRYPFSEIPKTQEAQKQWLIDRFREKDNCAP